MLENHLSLVEDFTPTPAEPDYSDLTQRGKQILWLMAWAEQEGIKHITLAIAESEGSTPSAIAAVQRHLHRRGYLDREGEDYSVSVRGADWWGQADEAAFLVQ